MTGDDVLRGHDTLRTRHQFRGSLVARTGVHVGASAGGLDVGGTDAPVIKDARGRPFLPGSSLRGALRSAIEALLRGLGHDSVCEPAAPRARNGSCSARIQRRRDELPASSATAPDPFELAWGLSCPVCRLFGNTFLAGRVRVGDLLLADDVDPAAALGRRDGVGIDRDLRTAAAGILYNFETAHAGLTFALRIDGENLDDAELGLLLVGLDLIGDGSAAVGGKSSRGLGRFELQRLTVRCRTARDYVSGTEGRELGSGDLTLSRSAAVARFAGGTG